MSILYNSIVLNVGNIMIKTSPLLKLLFLFLSFIFISGCGTVPVENEETIINNDQPQKSEKESDDTLNDSSKSGRDVVTAGDDQQILEGKSVVLSASTLNKEKKFVSFVWKEDEKILSESMEFVLEDLSIGVHEITLEATDENGIKYIDNIIITVKEKDLTNSTPVAKNLHLTIIEDRFLTTSLSGSDQDGDFLKYLLVSLPKHGVLSGSAAHLVYKPDNNFYGEDSFYFKVNDGKIDSDTATVTITVESENDAPVAYDLSFETLEDKSLDLKLKGDDVDGDTLKFRVTRSPSFGLLEIDADNVTYIPQNNFNGIDSFEYIALDDTLESKAATVTIKVKAVNDTPVVFDRVFQTDEDQPLEIALEGIDDEGHSLTFRLLSSTIYGDAKIVAGILYYTPYPNMSGVEKLEYVANDGVMESSSATITITINAKNDAPVAKNLLITTDEDQPKSFLLSAQDADGDSLTYRILKAPVNGTVKIDVNSTVTYTPNRYFNGNDSFTYVASDSKEDSNIAEVNIVITSVNNPPQVFSQTLSVFQNKELNITLEASDIENDPLTFYYEQPLHGLVSGTLPNLVYTPDANFTGEDSFFYWVNDTYENSEKKSITINVLQTPNTKPVADNKTVVMNEDENKTILLSGADNEQTDLLFLIKSEPLHGNITISSNTVVYTSFENFYGSDNFTYIANDGFADSDIATVNITVSSVNDAPVANPQTLLVNEDTNLSLTLSGSDIDGTIQEYIVTTNPTNGMINCNQQSCIYTPFANYFGSDFFEYIVNDGNLSSQPARVNISVVSQNDLPEAYDKNIEVNEDNNISFTLDAFDVENDIQLYSIITQPLNGNLLLDGNVVTYKPNENYNGSDSFTFRVKDSYAESQSATVYISVISVNDAPVVENRSLVLDEDSFVDINLTATDVDDENLTFSIVAQPLHGKFEGSAESFRYTPDKDYFGEDTVTYIASDSKSDSQEANISIYVNAVNDAPIADAGSDINVSFGTTVALNAQNSSDIDDTTLSYEWKENSLLLGEGVVLNIDNFSIGTHEITLTVTDSFGAKSSDTVIVTVNEAGTMILPYIPHIVTTTATDAQWLEMDDLDNDSDIDIVTVSKAGVAWYENLGGFTFKEHNISAITTGNFAKIGDLNNDGYKDILFSSSTNGYALNQCINDGNKNFNCSAISTTTTDISSFALADVNGDQNLDIVTASFANNRVDWILNVGDTFFVGPYTIDNQNILNAVFVDVSDFDKDGDIDIVAASGANNDIYWYENIDSTGFLYESHFQDNTIQSVSSVVAADINGDGYDDIISVSKDNGAVYWHPSLGGDTPSVTFSAPISVVSSLAGILYASGVDMDSDGDIDILTNSSQSGGKIAWYDNNGTGAGFDEHLVAEGVYSVSRVFGADMDNDSNMDIISADVTGNIVVYENNSSTIPLPKTGDKIPLYGEDDGKLQKGTNYIYKRDDINEIVFDTTSGLFWEDDANVKNVTYNWDSADSYCSSLDLGGFVDWRLPNIHELYFLLDRSKSSPTIKDGFVNTADSGYWTSVQVNFFMFTEALWVGFYDVRSEKDALDSPKYVRCVRGDEFILKLDRDSTKEIVNDFEHKLQWQDNADVESNYTHWTAAIDYCQNLSLDGYGWRVPNVNELHSLTLGAGWNSAFIYGKSSLYWSSTGSGGVTTVDFAQGYDNGKLQSDKANIRCVRSMGSQSL